MPGLTIGPGILKSTLGRFFWPLASLNDMAAREVAGSHTATQDGDFSGSSELPSIRNPLESYPLL